MRAALAVLLVFWVGGTTHAGNGSAHRDGKNQFQLRIPPAWKSTQGAETTLIAFESVPSGRLLTVTRVDFPNRRAWRNDSDFYDEVEQGVEKASKAYKRLARKRLKLGRIPVLELTFRRASADYPVIATRFMFFRRYTLIASVAYTIDAYKAHRRSDAKMLASFKPYFK